MHSGAHVVFGDIATESAESLVASLNLSHPRSTTFLQCDVRTYSDIYNLFRAAHSKYGRVDHAIASAGVFEQGNWFDPQLTIDSVGEQGGPTNVIDINVIGSANFARIAVVFLREGKGKGSPSLTLLSSVTAFRESPGLYMYQVSCVFRVRQLDCNYCGLYLLEEVAVLT